MLARSPCEFPDMFYIHVCAVLQPVGNEGCSQPCFLSMHCLHSPLLAFSGPIPNVYQRRNQEFTRQQRCLMSLQTAPPGVLCWAGGVGSCEEVWNEHCCTSAPASQPLHLTAFMSKGKPGIHLTTELWTRPFTTSKQFYLLPPLAPKPGHLRQVQFSAHLLFQRHGRSQDQSGL